MTTNVSTFASSEMTMRYREPYVTEGLNKKFAGVNPRGCYRGFRLGVDVGAGDRTVNIVASTSHSDHRAVYETATGYSIALRRTGGNFLISLTAYASQTVYVTLFASYSVGATTAAFMRIYTSAEYAAAAEKDELVVLGKVDVPAAGNPITSSMIWDTERDMAWDNQAVESAGWDQVHRNPFFVYGDNGGSYSKAASYWETYVDNPANGSISVSQTAPDVGFQHLIVTYAAGAPVFGIWQYLNTPVTAGQRIRLRLRKRSIQAALAGTGYFKPYWGDKDGTAVAGTNIPIVISAIDAAYVTVEVTFQVPSGLNIALLKYMVLSFDTVTFAAPGAAIYIGGFQMWVESLNPSDLSSHAENKNDGNFLQLLVQNKSGNFDSLAQAALLTQGSGAQPYLQLERADQVNSAAVTPISLRLLGALKDLGFNLLNSNSQALIPRILSQRIDPAVIAGAKTLMWELPDHGGGAGNYHIRIYRSLPSAGDEQLEIIHNASWDGTQWTADDITNYSFSHKFTKIGTRYRWRAAGAGTWTDTVGGGGWNTEAYFGHTLYSTVGLQDGMIGISGAGSPSNTNPLWSALYTPNILLGKTMIKAWGNVTTAPGVAAATINDGFNLTSATVQNPTGECRIVLNQDMNNANYTVLCKHIDPTAASDTLIQPSDVATGQFDVWAVVANTGAVQNMWSGSGERFCFLVLGEEV